MTSRKKVHINNVKSKVDAYLNCMYFLVFIIQNSAENIWALKSLNHS